MTVSKAAMAQVSKMTTKRRSRDLLKQRAPVANAPSVDARQFEALPDHGRDTVVNRNPGLVLQSRNRGRDFQVGADDRYRIRFVPGDLARHRLQLRYGHFGEGKIVLQAKMPLALAGDPELAVVFKD